MAQPGMVLDKAVSSVDGMILAGEGYELTQAGIDRLKNSGVGSITVKGRPFPNLPDEDINLETMRARLDFLFRKYRQDPLMWTFKNMVSQYLAGKIAAKAAEEAERMEAERAEK